MKHKRSMEKNHDCEKKCVGALIYEEWVIMNLTEDLTESKKFW